MSPEDLAPILLKLARQRWQSGGMFWPDSVVEVKLGIGTVTTIELSYPYTGADKSASVRLLKKPTARSPLPKGVAGIIGSRGSVRAIDGRPVVVTFRATTTTQQHNKLANDPPN